MTEDGEQDEWECHKIERIYNENVESLHAIAESFAESKYGYVIEARYFTKEGLDALRNQGYQVNHSEVRKPVKKGEDEPKVQISVDKRSGGDSSSSDLSTPDSREASSGGEPPKKFSTDCKNQYQDLQRSEKNELPTAATFTLDPKYKQGVIWNNEVDNAPELEEGDELVRRKDLVEMIDKRIEDWEEKRDSESGFNQLNISDMNARIAELKVLRAEIAGVREKKGDRE